MPIGAAGILLATAYVKDVEGEGSWPLDVTGFLLCGFGLAFLLFGLRGAGRGLIPWEAAILLAGSGTLLSLACAPRRFSSPRSQTSVDQNISRERDGRLSVPDRDWINSFFASADVANRIWDDRFSIRLGYFHCLGGRHGDESHGGADPPDFRLPCSFTTQY